MEQTRLGRIRVAFLNSVEREKGKPLKTLVKEQTLAPFQVMEGALQGIWRLLEGGWFREKEGPEKNPSKANEKKQKPRNSKPNQIHQRILDGLADKAVSFLNGNSKQRGKMVGELVPPLTLALLSKKLPWGRILEMLGAKKIRPGSI